MPSDRTRFGAYGAAACAVAYGSMKLAQALGANALADKDPLRPDLRERLLARDPMFVASHWILATAAVIGVLTALATVRPWNVPRRPLIVLTWTIGLFMIVRAIGVLGFGFVGDTLVLTGVTPPDPEYADLSRHLARWDLALWSPFFLTWGTCWTLAARHTTRTRRAPGRTPQPEAHQP
ncbi:DUF3995 domain-containing protein [Actinomadura oligospora]|uniref:DUF3995 domain-containing protein n=1 Tax=Actinomadura oligospora TaxID=111804 RepID=UPI0004B70812|nr:DUF3995 domain-containing protein [Actinomadura oligospora]